jgi:galactokinase
MANTSQIRNILNSGKKDDLLTKIYGPEFLARQKQRLHELLNKMSVSSESDVHIFSVPGRTELSGNHTDHNHGKVLAAAVHLDAVAIVSKTADTLVDINSLGMQSSIKVNLKSLHPQAKEKNTTESLIRGMAAQLQKKGYSIGGFRGIIASSIPIGSGLSSSAAIEVLIGTIFSHLYNKAKIPALEIAFLAQQAENIFFGKPCGLMDQIACVLGGIVAIDFAREAKPQVGKIKTFFQEYGYTLCVVNTGGSHKDLTDDYAAIQREMRATAQALDRSYCREISEGELKAALPELREAVGDRAILRAMHFLKENQRVGDQIRLLKNKKFKEYLELVNESGRSSWMLLQNCYPASDTRTQSIPLALALTALFTDGRSACRVHGGGFAGTIQAYIPNGNFAEYRSFMENIFGKGSVIPLQIREAGAVRIE